MVATSLALLPACRGGGASDTFAPCGEDELTWSNWADPFFTSWCDQCHSATTPNRFGAPEGVYFDSVSDVRERIESIRTTVLEYGTMPLGGGLSEYELEALDAFLMCLETTE